MMIYDIFLIYGDVGLVVMIVFIMQVMVVIFVDLFIWLIFFCFIQMGIKWVVCLVNGEMIVEEGDFIIFLVGLLVMLENWLLLNVYYWVDGVYFIYDLIDVVFVDQGLGVVLFGIQIVCVELYCFDQIFVLIQQMFVSEVLFLLICWYCLLEFLIWLWYYGVCLLVCDDDQLFVCLCWLIEVDLVWFWCVVDVVCYFVMSEVIFWCWLVKLGYGFVKILYNIWLEVGLVLL